MTEDNHLQTVIRCECCLEELVIVCSGTGKTLAHAVLKRERNSKHTSPRDKL